MVYSLHPDFPGRWATVPVTLQGRRVIAHGAPVSPRYVLADPTAHVAGTVLGRDRCTGMTLYRIQGPLHIRLEPPSRNRDELDGCDPGSSRRSSP
jgi:hypothetical protein